MEPTCRRDTSFLSSLSSLVASALFFSIAAEKKIFLAVKSYPQGVIIIESQLFLGRIIMINSNNNNENLNLFYFNAAAS